MIAEVSIYGVYVPWLLFLALLSIAATWGLGRVLASVGFYRLVWHPALFDFALFIVLLGVLDSLSSRWL
jgi:protein-S-isoprenylcysteine O-methyltransferase Ste14